MDFTNPGLLGSAQKFARSTPPEVERNADETAP